MVDPGPSIQSAQPTAAAVDTKNSVNKSRLRGVDKEGGQHRLVMSPLAFLKAQTITFCDHREVSAMAVVAEDDPLYIEDFDVVDQEGNTAYTEMDGQALLCRAEGYNQRGIGYDRTMRVWFHTHPSGCAANPSGTDNNTFAEVFGSAPFAVMLIHSKDGSWGATLRVGNASIGVKTKIASVEVDWAAVPDMPAFDPAGMIEAVKASVKHHAPAFIHAPTVSRWPGVSDNTGKPWYVDTQKKAAEFVPVHHSGGVISNRYDEGGYGPSEAYRPNRKAKKRRKSGVTYEDAAQMWASDFADPDVLERYLRESDAFEDEGVR